MKKLNIKEIGLIRYKDAFELQEKLFSEKVKLKQDEKTAENDFIICEHPHVYTLGKSGDSNNLLINADFLKNINAEFYNTNRGGDITYHGPGQIVGYPIIDIEMFGMGVKDYIYALEYMIIDLLGKYGIKGEISDGNIGVWLDVGTPKERKICAIGVKVSRGITMHGFALNVNTDLSYYNHINPCGFIDKGVTSMQKELNSEINISEVQLHIIEKFKSKFSI